MPRGSPLREAMDLRARYFDAARDEARTATCLLVTRGADEDARNADAVAGGGAPPRAAPRGYAGLQARVALSPRKPAQLLTAWFQWTAGVKTNVRRCRQDELDALQRRFKKLPPTVHHSLDSWYASYRAWLNVTHRDEINATTLRPRTDDDFRRFLREFLADDHPSSGGRRFTHRIIWSAEPPPSADDPREVDADAAAARRLDGTEEDDDARRGTARAAVAVDATNASGARDARDDEDRARGERDTARVVATMMVSQWRRDDAAAEIGAMVSARASIASDRGGLRPLLYSSSFVTLDSLRAIAAQATLSAAAALVAAGAMVAALLRR